MTEIINLRQQRKAKSRSEKEAQAAANRLKFGQTKSEKSIAKKTAEQDRKHIEGHRRQPDDETDKK